MSQQEQEIKERVGNALSFGVYSCSVSVTEEPQPQEEKDMNCE